MLCPGCNKFASHELGEPELELDVENGVVSGSCRIVITSECCGEEIEGSSFDLEPAVITELITSRVGELKDQDLWEEALGKQDGHRAELVRVSDRWEELQKFLEYEGQE